MELPEEVLADLKRSGLTDTSIDKMRIRVATVQDTAYNAQGYVIPYYTPREAEGKYVATEAQGVQFTRTRILVPTTHTTSNGIPKYTQPPNTGVHLYFPPLVHPDQWYDTKEPLIFTEGEKKAACGTQHGVLTVGLGGVDSWRSRKVTFKPTSVVSAGEKGIVVDLEGDDSKIESFVADELLWLPLEGRLVFVCFDAERITRKRENVGRAAFDFATWLESKGAEVRSIELPFETGKNGLDDFLVEQGIKELRTLMARARFPERPNIKTWISSRLDSPRKRRRDQVSISRAILSKLDRRGQRFKDPAGKYYYFDKERDVLYTVPTEGNPMVTSMAPEMMHMMVRDFGVTRADMDIMRRFTDDFESLPPIEPVEKVYKQSHCTRDAFYYQLNDSQVAKVTARGQFRVRNGADGILFESGARPVEPVPPNKVGKDINWFTTLASTSLEPLGEMTADETRALVACLFYLSPWLRRWRGLMLPAELAVSEAGSGKSSLYQLRSGVFTGSSQLKNPPEDIKDWYSSIAAARGIWIADNVGGKLDGRLSNEIARIITDPDPTFELRQLYTTAGLAQIPVDCTFCFTSIYNPFHRPDLLQRSLLLHFHAITKRDGSWVQRHLGLNYERRGEWITHHLQVIEQFLRLAGNTRWGEQSAHRLVGFEHALGFMGEAVGLRDLVSSAIRKLSRAMQIQITGEDPMLQAFVNYAHYRIRGRMPKVFSATDICLWSNQSGRYSDMRTLKNARVVDRYIEGHAQDILNASGIVRLRRFIDGEPAYEIQHEPLAQELL